MSSKPISLSESLVSYSHRSLWVALAFILLMAINGVTLSIDPGAKMAGMPWHSCQ